MRKKKIRPYRDRFEFIRNRTKYILTVPAFSYDDLVEIDRLLDRLLDSIKRFSDENNIDLATPDPRFIPFWWHLEDMWPDDWYKDYPVRAPYYNDFVFPTKEDEENFLLYHINIYLEEYLDDLLKCKKAEDLEYAYYHAMLAWWAVDIFEEFWCRAHGIRC